MGYRTTLERLEEAQDELRKVKAISANRAYNLELAEKRIEELEQANRQLIEKLNRRGAE